MIARMNVSPSAADWYYCAVVDLDDETDYLGGYATGDRPTLEEFREHHKCSHAYVGGMMYVSDEDLELVSETRKVECERCDHVYGTPEEPMKVIEWETAPTPHGAHSGEEHEKEEF